ncbi:hypothetical protein BDQ17DRAFT_1441706 [Cyathus striatus]|nr:hypothetical protein BDQ17DRAFT_1441706 [Cyathus striatus]
MDASCPTSQSHADKCPNIALAPENIQWNTPVPAPFHAFQVNQQVPPAIVLNAPAPVPIQRFRVNAPAPAPVNAPVPMEFQNHPVVTHPPPLQNNEENHHNLQWIDPAPAPAPRYHRYPEIRVPPAPPAPLLPLHPPYSINFNLINTFLHQIQDLQFHLLHLFDSMHRT